MVNDVRVAMDMNHGDSQLLLDEDSDTLTLNELISSKLTDAARIVEMEAPLRMLESGHDFAGLDGSGESNVFIKTDGKGYVILPHDFMRLICFRMSDWQRGVHEAISETDAAYSLMSSRHRGVSGSPEKPMVAIVRRAEGKVLEFCGSLGSTATPVQATYQPYPAIDKYQQLDMPEECYRPAVYMAAGLTLTALGDQKGAALMETSRAMLKD